MQEITQLLKAAQDGDRGAADQVVARLYADLQRLARSNLRRAGDLTLLDTQALVHEAWMRLSGNEAPEWADRRHFYASAAQAMRHVLIDHARSRGAVKRGGGRLRVPVDADDLAATADSQQIVALEGAVKRLEDWNSELGEVVRLRFYAGLTSEQAAEVMGLTLRTFKRRWSLARGWLERDIVGDLDEADDHGE